MTELNDLLKHTARSLYLSARLLPAEVRPAFCVAYLLCRYADTIADTSLLPPHTRLEYIKAFPGWIVQQQTQEISQLIRQISSGNDTFHEEKLLHNFPACLQALTQLPQPQQAVILQVVRAVCLGMEIDLQTFPNETDGKIIAFSTQAELENYCHLMGGAPGVFWSQLISQHTPLYTDIPTFYSLGKQIGDALQIVNILRDLPRDLRIGRCYFPQEDLAAQHLQPADLLSAEHSRAFEPVKRKWIAWGRHKLQAAYAYFAALPKTQFRHRTAVAWPALWAADTLYKLEQEPNLLNPAVRVKISRRRIYGTMAATLPILLSNTLFNKWLSAKLSDGK